MRRTALSYRMLATMQNKVLVFGFENKKRLAAIKNGHGENRTKDYGFPSLKNIFWPTFEWQKCLTQGTTQARSRRPRRGRDQGARRGIFGQKGGPHREQIRKTQTKRIVKAEEHSGHATKNITLVSIYLQ